METTIGLTGDLPPARRARRARRAHGTVCLVVCVLLGCLLSACGSASAHRTSTTPSPPPKPIAHHANFRYGVHQGQRLTAYWHSYPRGAKVARRPVIILVHGGYWRGGTRRTFMKWASKWSGIGYVSVTMDYRLTGTARWPAQRDDVLHVIRWVHKHAGTLHADPRRIVLIGSSSGGQVTASVGTYRCGGCRVIGVAALSAVENPHYSWRLGRQPDASKKRRKLSRSAVRLTGCRPRTPACMRRWRNTIPADQASRGDAPMLLIHARRDMVPVSEARSLQRALHAYDVPVTVRVVPMRAHGIRTLKYPKTARWVADWVKRRVAAAAQAGR